MSEEKGLDSLKAWRQGVDFAKRVIREVVPVLPPEEKYAMGTQLRRASQSIAANVAEGYGRFYYQEGVRFCYTARGSLDEVFTYLTLANELGYIKPESYASLVQDVDALRRLISGYIGFLKKSKRGEQEAGASHAIREPAADYDIYLDEDEDSSSLPR
jgi:four helix bundle protein